MVAFNRAKLKELRKSKKLTQQAFAKLIGKSYSIYQKYELGLTQPPFEVVCAMADVLGINPADLIDYTPMEKALEQWAENYDANNLPDEVKLPLLRSFAQLNDDGRNKVIEYVEDITPKYKK